MSEFKVGDRVRIVEKGITGTIYEVAELVVGACLDFTVGEYEITNIYKVRDGLKIYINLKERDLELIEKAKEPTTLEELEQRIEKLEKEVFKSVEFHVRTEETKSSLLTEDERVILRNINKEFKWIIRNEHYLTVTERKPRLDKYGWGVGGGLLADLPFIKLFKFIKFEDGEPYNIEELLKGECGNEI